MYLEKLELIDIGPIEHLNLQCQFSDDGNPKPVILVGTNGSGKSLAIAHVVNSLISAQGKIFEDSDVDTGKVYKLRHPHYIRHGATYSIGKLHFSDGFFVSEIQLAKPKSEYQDPQPEYSRWEEIQDAETSHYHTNFAERSPDLKNALNRASHLFFPPNRFEEPAWLNEQNLRNKVNYPELKFFTTHSNRPVVNYAPLRELQNWLLDLIYDSYAVESTQQNIGRGGPATEILNQIEGILRTLFGKSGQIRWRVGVRNRRKVGVSINGELITNNLFGLSTGQTALLDLFLTIVRDFDLSQRSMDYFGRIQGIVIVDEIDLHLHADLQHDVLPCLIRLFPGVQFILTTHAPLFLIGMEKVFTANGIQLVELPSGQEIEVERFSEFDAAFEYMKQSARFEENVKKRIKESQKPILYLEGDTDLDYINKAAEFLKKKELLDKFELVAAGGCPYLDKLWNTYRKKLADSIKQKWILLYDCDAKKSDENVKNLIRRGIPKQDHKICSGIENLFPDETIQRARNHSEAFVDVEGERTDFVGGVETPYPEQWKVNKDQKRNLCNWLTNCGQASDFSNFSLIFDILEEVLDTNGEQSKNHKMG